MTTRAARAKVGSRGGRWLNPQLVRSAHTYAGALFAPTLVFFAVSGGLQVFDLHKAGPAYRPPAAMLAMARLHKDQLLEAPRPADEGRAQPSHRPERRAREGEPRPWSLGQTLLKAFAAAGAVTLTLSTLLGLYLSLLYRRDRVLVMALVAVGTIVPVGLMLL